MTTLNIQRARGSGASPAPREVRIRLPEVVVLELKRMADLEGTTMNALVAEYIDKGLRREGRPGVFAQASWFRQYLRRKGGRDSSATHRIDHDEDFT